MAEAACEYPGCGREVLRACDRCRRSFCARHIEPLYPDVSPERSPWRCTLCTREVRQEARGHTRRSRRGLAWAGALVVLGVIMYVVGTALAPDSDEVTFAALLGLILAGVGAISAVYSLVAR
jgi:uncharacterized paraquat-inducible protein A